MTQIANVAVVGAGFSGLLTAVRLLLAPEGPRVTLIERGEQFGRGAAYGATSPQHLLNVRATNMSAFVEQPSHFLEWLGGESVASRGGAAPESVFVTRERYGQYLQSILRRAASDGRAAGRLMLEHDEVVSISSDGERWSLGLALGHTVTADAVVLALGNPPPAPPPAADPEAIASPRYVANPWNWDAAGAPDGDILLLGTGLTAIDATLSILDQRPGGRIIALSRHGLTPHAHGEAKPPGAFAAPVGSPAQVLRQLRRLARDDWRGAVDALRPHVQGLWRGWSLAQRRAFLRRLRPWWDIHRHRMAPEVAERIATARARGALEVAAGRLQRLAVAEQGLRAAWLPRGASEIVERTFGAVVNCSGPMTDLEASPDPLVGDLLARGLIRPDACALGLDVDSHSRVVGADGHARETLFAVGPITRGQFYEITSVPDIRLQAADCAGAILAVLALRARPRAADEAAVSPDKQILADLRAMLEESLEELDVELGSLKFTRRVRNAWELRGRRAALDQIALWLDARSQSGKA